MSERTPSPGDQSQGMAEPRAIPDGGLGEAMPEWLRRPPAWRQLEPKAPPPKSLPPPDTSVIDPATLVSVDDLPAWLQTVARAAETLHEPTPAPPASPERRVIPRVIEARPPRPAERDDRAVEPAEGPAVVPLNLDHAARGGFANATIVLGTLLAVALVVIVVLLWLLYA